MNQQPPLDTRAASGDAPLDRALAQLSTRYPHDTDDLPPPALDDAIRAAARRAVASQPQSLNSTPSGLSRHRSWTSRWAPPLSAAALVMLTASIGYMAWYQPQNWQITANDLAASTQEIVLPEAKPAQPRAATTPLAPPHPAPLSDASQVSLSTPAPAESVLSSPGIANKTDVHRQTAYRLEPEQQSAITAGKIAPAIAPAQVMPKQTAAPPARLEEIIVSAERSIADSRDKLQLRPLDARALAKAATPTIAMAPPPPPVTATTPSAAGAPIVSAIVAVPAPPAPALASSSDMQVSASATQDAQRSPALLSFSKNKEEKYVPPPEASGLLGTAMQRSIGAAQLPPAARAKQDMTQSTAEAALAHLRTLFAENKLRAFREELALFRKRYPDIALPTEWRPYLPVEITPATAGEPPQTPRQ